MATLLPSMASDEEEDNTTTLQENDSDSSEDEVNEELDFGGILGEDGCASDWMAAQGTQGWNYQSALDLLEKNDATRLSMAFPRMDVASLIAAKRRNLKRKEEECENDDEDCETSDEEKNSENSESFDGDSESEDEPDTADGDMETDTLKIRAGQKEQQESDGDEEVKEEAAKAVVFFESHDTSNADEVLVFEQLTLSRPLLRGIAAMGFVRPTPIQASMIPLALAGRDVCASAVTGSGKTAAFVLPILERLTQRTLGTAIKGLILTPTRELAAQCLGMMATLAQYTNIRATLVVGGAKNVNAQAAELRTRPDIVIATPGRLLDHVTNSPGVTLDDIEFLILDEADRLLDLGFQDEVHEIIKACPTERQTMLFSATMTTKVDDLVKLSLKRPVRVKISEKDKAASADVEVAPRLEQEFVRVRSGNEGVKREGMLLALLSRTFTARTIVFFDTKAAAHRLMILCGLCGIKCAELHGNLTQTQRLTALEQFRSGEVDVLLATDLAARGLDIDRLETVVNFEMPSQVETYVHRIGRTARAGRRGKSCTLIGEGRRYLMKEVIKDAEEKGRTGNYHSDRKNSGIIRSRTIPPAVVAHFVAKIDSLEPHVDEVLQAEAVARLDRLAQMEAMKAKNIIEHSDEIHSRPQREWFASMKQKQSTKVAVAEKQKLIEEKAGTGMHRMTRKKRRAREAKEDLMCAQEEMQKEQEEQGTKPKKLVTDKSIKSSARSQKRKVELMEKGMGMRSIHDEDQERKRKEKEKKKRRKGAFATDAAGDSSLFDDETMTFARKDAKTDKPRPSSYQFSEYNPSGPTRKHKKKTVNAFKSKSKYKRRK